MRDPLRAFAAQVGGPADGPVACAGGGTHWDVGGPLRQPVRVVPAPAGVVAHEPGEMIVRARAGTTLAELDAAVAAGGQFVAVDGAEPERATVGGALACGLSGLRRLGHGPVRDTVLEVTLVSAGGDLVRAGAPLVKNVTGFDLCRLFVGSLGTLAFLGEVVLRCQPRPAAERWWRSPPGADPFTVHRALYRPLAVLWDGDTTWVGLAGHPSDVAEQAAGVLASGFTEVEGPPVPPDAARRSMAPGGLRGLPGRIGPGGAWLAEVGVGVVHCDAVAATALAPSAPPDGIVGLHRRLKANFDPGGRLNPGRSPLAGAAAGAAR